MGGGGGGGIHLTNRCVCIMKISGMATEKYVND